MKNATNTLALVDRPNDYDIEAVRPHVRKHLRPYKLLIADRSSTFEKPVVSEVTINGTNLNDAKKRFKAMTGSEVAFFPVKGQR